MKKTRSNTTMIEQTHNQVPQEPTTDSTVAASLRTLTICLDQLLNRESEETITYDGDEPAAHFFSQLESQPNFHNLEPARQARKALSSLRGEPRKIAQDLALLNKTYEEVKESLCAVYPRRPSFTLQEFYELKCTSMAEIETYYKNKVRIGLAINLPKSAIVQALSNGVPPLKLPNNYHRARAEHLPPPWTRPHHILAVTVADNTGTHSVSSEGPTSGLFGPLHLRSTASSNPKDRLGLQVSTRPQQRRAREKPSNASFGSRTPPKLNEPTCTLNQHTPAKGLPCQAYCDASTQGIAGVLKQVHPDAYDYEVKYLKGSRQYEADLLSRNPFCGFLSTGQIKDHQGELRRDTRYILNDKDLMTIIRRGVTKIIVPPSLRGTLLQRAHRDFNHPGISQMTRLIAAQYYWDGMTNDIRTHVRTCSVCQLVKPPKGPIYGELGQLPPAVLPYELVSLDTISGFAKYGNSQTCLHVVVDHATRYAWAFPSRSTSILTYTQVIKKVMQFGSPKRLLTDRAPAFTSPKFRRFFIRHNIGQLLTTSNNPQANGLSERLNATITGKLKLLRLQQPKTAWTKLLPQVKLSLWFLAVGCCVAYQPYSYGAPAVMVPMAAPQPISTGYNVDDGHNNNFHHNEETDANGHKKGSFGYTNEDGLYRTVNYIADDQGFRASILSNEPGLGAEGAAGVNVKVNPVPAHIKAEMELLRIPKRPQVQPAAAMEHVHLQRMQDMNVMALPAAAMEHVHQPRRQKMNVMIQPAAAMEHVHQQRMQDINVMAQPAAAMEHIHQSRMQNMNIMAQPAIHQQKPCPQPSRINPMTTGLQVARSAQAQSYPTPSVEPRRRLHIRLPASIRSPSY
ncbi:hypothetical protein LAZ67_3004299 [Cordylochernes scorpioides]|uniref:RNA-directed DNA polymerase n=1 Tax=Cordylochernes scorpioides TaxID=51811 RepID=A0ABY6K9P5_9ARAC|nr:hypothetical protein LAZ67_3004299 [Cordylochernes scorpioides]